MLDRRKLITNASVAAFGVFTLTAVADGAAEASTSYPGPCPIPQARPCRTHRSRRTSRGVDDELRTGGTYGISTGGR